MPFQLTKAFMGNALLWGSKGNLFSLSVTNSETISVATFSLGSMAQGCGRNMRWPGPCAAWSSVMAGERQPEKIPRVAREGAVFDNGLTQSQEANKVINISTLRCSLENCNIIKGCQGGCIALAYRNVPLRVLTLGSPIRYDLIPRPLTGTKISMSQGV